LAVEGITPLQTAKTPLLILANCNLLASALVSKTNNFAID
jgi:hypothetical protein